MRNITFSHQYTKLKGMGTKALLIAVFPYTVSKDTPREFLEYDTSYDGGHYELKKGEYVLLLFLGAAGLFTTIRPRKSAPWMPVGDKLEYYKARVGEFFKIKVKDIS